MLGLKWRSALLQAEALSQLNSGQFGSRPKHNATDPVFLEELQLELSRITRKTVALTNYDATACYDRIVPNLAMLASRKFGVPASVTNVNANTLELSEYRIRTDLGLAEQGYHHSAEQPIYGTGQGSGNSPVIWCFISSILFDCYEECAHLAQYSTPDNKRHITLGMIGYVDDSNGQTNCFYEGEGAEVSQVVKAKMRENANTWSKLLGVSGGALELTKCSYHIVTWKFSSSGAPVLSTDRAEFGGIKVSDMVTGEEQELQYLSPYESHKTLGHYKEPAGTQTMQFRKLWEKSNELTSFLWSHQVTREEAWTFYFSTYLPSVSYPLANSHFTERQLTKLQRKAMNILFAKCGYNRNVKREVLFGPLELGGANFRRLYDQQGIGQIGMFLRHWRSSTQVGELLRIVVEWCNYAAGISRSVLEDTRTPLPHLESKWVGALRTYLHSIGAYIQVDNTGIPPLEREHDQHIMEEVVNSGQFNASEIRKINYCRLYLRAVTVSDLTTTKGDQLDQSKLAGELSLQSSRSRWHSIHQEKPSLAEWRLWRKANRLWAYSSGRLLTPLGRWLRNHRDRRGEFSAYQYRNHLAVRVAGGFVMCQPQSSNIYFETDQVVKYRDIPNEAVPATVVHTSDACWEVIHRCEAIPNAPRVDWSTFHSFLESLEPWETDLLRHTRLYVDPRLAVLELQDNFRAGSDGSSKHGKQGAFGWSVRTMAGETIADGNGPSRGATVDSYRAECSGMLAFLRFLIRIAEYTDMFGSWVGCVGTDSQSMLDRLFGKRDDSQSTSKEYTVSSLRSLDVLDPEWDLLNEIQITLRQLPDVTLEYVKGHQDDDTEYSRLSLMAQLNVDADGLATRYQQEVGRMFPQVLMSANAGAYLVVEEGTVTNKMVQTVRYLATGPSLRTYIMKKNHWDETVMRSINWKAHAKFMKSQIARRVHFSKMVHECLPTHSLRNRFDSGRRTCPSCPSENETRDHILRCSGSSRVNWRDYFMRSLERFHVQENTSPFLAHLLREALSQWFQEADSDITVSPIFFPIEVRDVIIQQNAIGWRQIFNARFGCEWSRVQQEYYCKESASLSGKKQRTGERWQIKLTKLIGDNGLELWKVRNAEVHGHDYRTHAEALRREVSRQLDGIYQQRAHYEPQVQRLLLPDVNEHFNRPTWVTRNWLAINAPIFRESMRRARDRAIQGVRTLHAYFPSMS